MIINNLTVDGENIFSLPFSSKKKVNRICDLCGNVKTVTCNTIFKCRKKHNTDKDYCFLCSMKIYNTGENNSAKREDVKEKISLAGRGKSKSFKDGKNLRILDRKISSSGHVLKWVEEEKKHVAEHRIIYSEQNMKNHSDLAEIHHIDGDKKNS